MYNSRSIGMVITVVVMEDIETDSITISNPYNYGHTNKTY